MPNQSGYSKRSLVEKLGVKPASSFLILQAPTNYAVILREDLPQLHADTEPQHTHYDIIQFFATSQKELIESFPKLKAKLHKNGTLWISWPKQTAKTDTDLNETHVQRIGLENGLVDVKVIAVDEKWSGLKFVYRLKDR